MLTLLRKKAKAYTGRHSDDHRAPTGTECVNCGATEPSPDAKFGPDEQPLKLVHCSVCPGWMCSGECFSLHRAPASFYAEDARASWWKRAIGRA